MKPDDPKHPWSRLAAAARQVPDSRATAAPYGFSTRVVALALAGERKFVSPYERLALRAVGLAGLLAMCSVAANFSAMGAEPDAPEIVLEDYDPVAVLLDE